jgi:hypothetical protein
VVKTVKGASTASATMTAAWDKGYSYVISPYLSLNGATYVNLDENKAAVFVLPTPAVRIASVTKASAKKLKVTWTAYKGATSFKLYRSTKENSGYKVIATLDAGVTSHTSSATPGTIYYYKVIATYGTTGEVSSSSFAQQIPVVGAASAASKAKTAKVSSLANWYNVRDVYTYAQGFTTYVASLAGRTLTVQGFMGVTGNNYTGASLDGMEVGKSNVLMCGTSVPQNYAVQGIKGDSPKYKRNLYVTVTNRTSGKTKVKWLTIYKPTGKTGVVSASMVKLSEERFGILYVVNSGGKNVPHYMVIDGNGEKVFKRKIDGVITNGVSNVVFSAGRIVWVSPDANYKGRICSIQAL